MARKILVISGPIGFDVTVSGVRDDLNKANGADIEMQMASPGGFVSPGLEIFNLIRDYPGNINFRVMGQVASMGSYLLMAREGRGTIRVHDNSVFMMHKPMTIGVGNDEEFEKISVHLKGLTAIFANGYAVQSGKPIDEIIELLKETTFYYGSEIVDAGFADEVIITKKSGKKKDKAAAIIEAKASIENCVAMMRDSEYAKEDTLKAVAYLKDNVENNNIKIPGPETDPGNNIDTSKGLKQTSKEEDIMDLKKLLGENPEARTEFDQAIADATKAGVDSVQATIKKVVPIMLSDDYSQSLKSLGGKVLEGSEPVASFTAVVTIEDGRNEAEKAKKAEDETGKETPAGPGGGAVAEDGSINNPEDFEAAIANIKADKEAK